MLNNLTDTVMIQFEIGKTYGSRSICDSDCIFEYVIIGRTAKQLTMVNWKGETVRKGVREQDGEEVCYPEGRYSMCPIIRASRRVY